MNGVNSAPWSDWNCCIGTGGTIWIREDPALFQRVHVQHGTTVWTDEIDLSPDTLYLRVYLRGQSLDGVDS